MAHCGICGRERQRNQCVIIKPTDAEKAAMKEAGLEAAQEYVYCRPCHRTVTDPVTGPDFMKGLVQTRLQQMGVARAEEIAETYRRSLLAKSGGKQAE